MSGRDGKGGSKRKAKRKQRQREKRKLGRTAKPVDSKEKYSLGRNNPCKPITVKDIKDFVKEQGDFMETSDNWPVYNPENGVFEPK